MLLKYTSILNNSQTNNRSSVLAVAVIHKCLICRTKINYNKDIKLKHVIRYTSVCKQQWVNWELLNKQTWLMKK